MIKCDQGVIMEFRMKGDCRSILPFFPFLTGGFLLIFLLCVVPSTAAEVNMAEVRRLAENPVKTILLGTPVLKVNDATYQSLVFKSTRPVIVVFYANQDQDSRNLATLLRYLSFDFQQKITFCIYEVAEKKPIPSDLLGRLQKTYSLDKVPGTFFYDNDKGKIELEREHYEVPSIKEYRAPKMLFWKTYYETITKYIEKNILD
jgi:hypothetical protein